MVAETARDEAAELPDAPAAATAVTPPEDAVGTAVQGGVLARGEAALYVADEDRSALRVIPLPIESNGEDVEHVEITLPGRPAAVVPLAERILVTVREPGLLIALEPDADGDLGEVARTSVPDDAWGLAVTPDGATALVTSAWTHAVTAVDIDTMMRRWSLSVAREPRAVVVGPGGDHAYVTHLMGSALTRIDDLRGATPSLARISFAAAPLRNPGDEFAAERADAASLAYAAVLSPDGSRMFVPRHALGATGKLAWNGQPTVDILLTASETSLAEPVDGHAPLSRIDVPLERRDVEVTGAGPIQRRPVFAQPRAAVYRERTDTLLIASEGQDSLVELDALSVDPSAHELRRFELDPWVSSGDDMVGETSCGAPSGVALSADEMTAYVFCRSTGSLAVVPLDDLPSAAPAPPIARLQLAHDPLDDEAALGRRLFYEARDFTMAPGFGCAGCHPDGRDDGYVWHQIGTGVYRAFPELQPAVDIAIKGEARQTPMLAGRVDGDGPFGWRGESESLSDRIVAGFMLHRWWSGGSWILDGDSARRAKALAGFLRRGLVAPATTQRELSAVERRGQELFNDATIGCASCHSPDDGSYSDGERVELDLRAPSRRYRAAERPMFRTPSLRFVGGTPPYLHDGSVATLADLLERNHDRMGLTSQLSGQDAAALVAFVDTFGGAPAVRDVAYSQAPTKTPRRVSSPLSAEPSAKEWQHAEPLALSRASDRCKAVRLQKWVQIRCNVYVTEVELIGGSAAGVSLRHSKPYIQPPSHWWQHPEQTDDAVLTFPVQPGDRRLFQLVESDFVRWGGVDLDVRLAVSEHWLEGEPGPTITVH